MDDHAVFTWTGPLAEMFVTIAKDDCICVCDDREKNVRPKHLLEELLELTLQEGNTIRFLILRINQSPQCIIIDQTDHIVDTVNDPYLKDSDYPNPGNHEPLSYRLQI
jgi:hypothetical protein